MTHAEQNLRLWDLPKLKMCDIRKVVIAARTRRTTAVPLAWIAEEPRMGSPSNVPQSRRCNQNP